MKKFILLIISIFIINIAYAQWQPVNPITKTNAIAYCTASQDSMMYVGTNKGLFISSDYGNTWINRIPNIPVYTIAIKDNKILVGDTLGGIQTVSYIHFSLNYGLNWDSINFFSNYGTSINLNGANNLVSSKNTTFYILRGRYLLTTEDFNSWEIDSLLSIYPSPNSLTVNHINNNIYITDYSKLFLSNNNGSTWSVINSNILMGMNFFGNIVYSEGDTIYLSTENNGLMKTINNGLNWTLINSTTLTNYVNIGAIYSIFKTGTHLFIGASPSKIFLSNDFGLSWSNVGLGLPSVLGGGANWSFCIYNNYLYVATAYSNNFLGLYRRPLCEMITDFPNNGVLTGDTIVCNGQQNVSYSLPAIQYAQKYQWTLPSGFTIVGNDTTNNVTINVGANASSGLIYVKGYNGCKYSDSSALFVQVNTPPPLGNIIGSYYECQGQSSVLYHVTPNPNAFSYVWSFPNGVSGTSNTDSINVNFGTNASSGYISVKSHNACGDGVASNFYVVVSNLPANASTITGPLHVCKGQLNVTYTIPSIAFSTSYNWSLPNGITGASNTNSITVNIDTNASSGNIIVKGINSCGAGDTSVMPIIVKTIPIAQGQISGLSLVNQGQSNVVYTIPPSAGADSYLWSLPVGAFGSSTTNNISINYSTLVHTGLIKVKAHNNCGDSSYTSLAVNVQNSLGFNVRTINDISLFPNPVSNFSTITYTLKHNQQLNISIYDITGRKTDELLNTYQQSGQHHLTLDISELTPGIYLIKAIGDENFETIKFNVIH